MPFDFFVICSSRVARKPVVKISPFFSGWVKTFDDYYKQQTKNIFELMLTKLEQYPKGKFMYAEMSFFSKWWNEIDAAKRDRVKR